MSYVTGSLSDASIFEATALARHLNAKSCKLPPDAVLPGSNIKIPHFLYLMRVLESNPS